MPKKKPAKSVRTPEIVPSERQRTEGWLVALQSGFEYSAREKIASISRSSTRTLNNLERLLELHEAIAERSEELLREEEGRARELGLLESNGDEEESDG